MARIALVLIVASVAAAGPLTDYKRAVRKIEKKERAYYKEFQKKFRKAWDARRQVLIQYHHLKSNEIDSVNDAVRTLWEELRAIEDARRAPLVLLAKAGNAREIYEVMLAAALEGDALDRQILVEKSRAWNYLNDQEPAFRRQALAIRQQLCFEALMQTQGSVEFVVGDAWPRAVKKDKKGALVRRLTALDFVAQGRPGHELVVSSLQAKEPELRIAAMQGLVPHGTVKVDALLSDKHPVVRRALLQDIRRKAADRPEWAGPLIARFAGFKGIERVELIRTLRVLSGETFGDQIAAWQAWWDEHKEAINNGVYDRPKREKKTVAKGPAFYGIPIRSRALTLLCEWGHTVVMPLDVKFQRTKMAVDWFGMDMKKLPDWEKKFPSRRRVFLRQFESMLGKLPKDSRVGLVLLADGSKNDVHKFQESNNLAPVPLDKKGRKKIDRVLQTVPGWSRWQAPYAGMLIAMKLGGADTLVLVHDGLIRGSRYLLPEHILADFVRRRGADPRVLHGQEHAGPPRLHRREPADGRRLREDPS